MYKAGKNAADKRSKLLGPFVSYKENEVFWKKYLSSKLLSKAVPVVLIERRLSGANVMKRFYFVTNKEAK